MRPFNWAKSFEETPTRDQIIKRVHRTEILYWVFLLVSVFIALAGYSMIEQAPPDDSRRQAFGLFWAILGIVNIATIKIWAHVRLTTYYIIMERRKWTEYEMQKSEAQDL